jgi:hypothetical protein
VNERVCLACRGCSACQEFILPDGIPPPASYLCRVCSRDGSMLDGVDWSRIGATKLARMLAWRREAELQREVSRQGGEAEDGYVIYLRRKDRACKFRRRNGFTLMDWHARVDQLGWNCSFCGCDLTKMTVLRWSLDGTKKLESQVPVCRRCQCQRVGGAQGNRCPTMYIGRGENSAPVPGPPADVPS